MSEHPFGRGHVDWALPRLVRRLIEERRASVVTIFAIALPILAVAVTAVAELAEVQTAGATLQSGVDSAAIKGAREFETDQSSATTERARLFADDLAQSLKSRWSVTTNVTTNSKIGAVTVTQNATRSSLFGNLLPPGGFHLAVTATAQANSSIPLCVLALHPNAMQVLSLQNRSVMQAANCLVQSNSDLSVGGSANLASGEARSVGAASGSISPSPVSDAPSIPDPFAALAINVPLRCDNMGLTIGLNATETLAPGVHCGPILFIGNGTLNLAPGEHYFSDSNMIVIGSSQVTGTDVVVILSGSTTMTFLGSAGLSLEGRRSGPYAGFVLVSDRRYSGTVALSTTSARKLLGTIYLPNATFSVSGNGNKVADQSPWTVVVADQLKVSGSANLVINASYFAAPVPVPSGVGPNGTIQLTR